MIEAKDIVIQIPVAFTIQHIIFCNLHIVRIHITQRFYLQQQLRKISINLIWNSVFVPKRFCFWKKKSSCFCFMISSVNVVCLRARERQRRESKQFPLIASTKYLSFVRIRRFLFAIFIFFFLSLSPWLYCALGRPFISKHNCLCATILLLEAKWYQNESLILSIFSSSSVFVANCIYFSLNYKRPARNICVYEHHLSANYFRWMDFILGDSFIYFFSLFCLPLS